MKERGDIRKVFWKCGACSHTFFFLLNREFGHLKRDEESASDPLAGGLMQTGNQCGMLWGASLAAGAEAFRRENDPDKAAALAITATRHLMESFSKTAGTVDCREFTGCDFTKKWDMRRYMLKTILCLFVYSPCFNLAVKWGPEAVKAAEEGLAKGAQGTPCGSKNCASEVARKMGATAEEAATVAGFAGGLGLSGNGCGALAAALWMNTLDWCRKNPGKTPPYFNNPSTQKILETFYAATGSAIRCDAITGKRFGTIEEHDRFVREGGCGKLIDALAQR